LINDKLESSSKSNGINETELSKSSSEDSKNNGLNKISNDWTFSKYSSESKDINSELDNSSSSDVSIEKISTKLMKEKSTLKEEPESENILRP